MAIDPITALPAAPDRGLAQEAFSAQVKAWLDQFSTTTVAELNAAFAQIPLEVAGVNYQATSASSVAIGTGSKSFTIETGKLFGIGQSVTVASTANPANFMFGTVTAHNPATGALTVNVASIGGSGTLAAWAISLAATGDALLKAGGTMAGLLIALTSASGGAGLRLPHGAAPTSPVNGDLWSTTAGLFARINAVTRQLATLDGAETLTGKTLVNLLLSGSVTETSYAITDGAGFELNPANGTNQKITLGANRTPKATSFADGQSMMLRIAPTTYALTWSDTTFGASGIKWSGGVAGALSTTQVTRILLDKDDGQVTATFAGYT